MNRIAVAVGAIVALSVLSWFFPVFHVVSRESLRAEKESARFDAAAFVKDFWTTKLTPALADSADVVAVLAAYRESPEQARTQFGRTVGIGRSTLYFVQGRGKITSIDKKQIVVALTDDPSGPHVALQIGLLFGNTVRDATGLLSGNDYPNSQQFNEISAELNRTIEADVLPTLKAAAKVGATVEFVGAAEVTNESRDLAPLKVVPIEAKVK